MSSFMHSMFMLLFILLPLFVGYAIPSSIKLTQWSEMGMRYLVMLILTYLGIELAQIDGLGLQIGQIIGRVSVLVGLTISCGLFGVWLFDKFKPWRPDIPQNANDGNDGENTNDVNNTSIDNQQDGISFGGTVLQILCVCIGFSMGRFIPDGWLPPSYTITGLLMLLILLVGISLKGSGVSLKEVLLNKRGVQLAVVFTVSVLSGGVLYAFILPDVHLTQGLALSSGFGWYSLSAVVMTDAYGAVWGSVALFNDLIREIFSLLFIPLIMRYSPMTAVSVGGVTSLDFTLPIIQQSGGVAVVPLTISCSFILNIISPIMMLGFSSMAGL